jgi:hypothetical protein
MERPSTTDPNGRLKCGCVKVISIRRAVEVIVDELKELIDSRDMEEAKEELSDVCFSIGRLLGAIIGKTYVAVPYDRRCQDKRIKRLKEHGCIRSKRNLVRGRCPNE